MPGVSASDGSSQIISFRTIGIGTVFVLAAVFIAWLSHTAAGERLIREQERLNEMAAESHALCEKWGMPLGSSKHDACVADIQTVRDNHARRIALEEEPF